MFGLNARDGWILACGMEFTLTSAGRVCVGLTKDFLVNLLQVPEWIYS